MFCDVQFLRGGSERCSFCQLKLFKTTFNPFQTVVEGPMYLPNPFFNLWFHFSDFGIQIASYDPMVLNFDL